MAAKPKQMHQIRRIIELVEQNYSTRKISVITGIARNTISDYRTLITSCNITLSELLKADDEILSAIVYRKQTERVFDGRWNDLEARIPDVLLELKRTGVTRKLLWEEYKRDYPDGYGYTQFCDHIARHISINGAVMHFQHQPGEQMQIDFAGDQLFYVDTVTGEMIGCQILICSLPFSQYTYVEALPSQRQEHFFKGLSNALYFFGGVPQSIKTDNLKPAVIKANRYEPAFTEAMQYFAQYYHTTAMAARVRKPRDKPSVEGAVLNSYRRIYAPLRNAIFTSIAELNDALHRQLENFNTPPFQKRDHSRKIVFETEEKQILKPLPSTAYEIKHSTQSKVQKNYHVILGEDWHQYSVPYTLIGKTLKLIYTSDMVEIYLEQKRIALHKRNYRKHGYTTLTEHMPDNHAHMIKSRGWDADYFLAEGKLIGTGTQEYIGRILSSKSFPEQTYNSCLGILRLGKQYGILRLEAACLRALHAPVANYGVISTILKKGFDKITEPEQTQIPFHDNIRGNTAYN